MWRRHELEPGYDVVIIGGGVHGLAAAYYLAANHGISNVAVLDKGYIGGGGSGRNTAILRSNYLTPEGVRFYDRSMELYRGLAADLNFNVMFARRGHLTLAHNDGIAAHHALAGRGEQAAGRRLRGHRPGRDQAAGAVPGRLGGGPLPDPGALYHPPGGIIRHDAVVWGYARGADARGVHIHQDTEVTGIDVAHGKVTGVRTSRGPVSAPVVLNCTAGWSTLICDMAGVQVPVQTFPLQAAVTEPVRPFLDAVVVSGSLHVYVSQTDRGELVFGASVDPYPSYSMRGSLDFIEGLAGHVLELMPSLATAAAAAAVGRAVRHDPGLLADHGPDPGRRLPGRRRLGHLRVQGRPGVRRGDGRDDRRGQAAAADRPVRPGPVRRRAAARGKGGGVGWPLILGWWRRDPADLPMVRAA